MRIGIAIIAMVLYMSGTAGLLLGQTYEWTDAKGVVHFTDNRESVPRKYKGTVRLRESVRSGAEDQTPTPQQTAPVRTPGPARGEELYGGKPYAWWRAQYLALTGERGKAAAQLDELKTKDAVTKRRKLILQRGIDRAAVKEVEGQVAAQEERVRKIDADIDELTAAARKAGVPARWNE